MSGLNPKPNKKDIEERIQKMVDDALESHPNDRFSIHVVMYSHHWDEEGQAVMEQYDDFLVGHVDKWRR